tara:strand:- start:115 stop:519 length:405 start_codon:yes stop_codon:yes gene_type:complete
MKVLIMHGPNMNLLGSFSKNRLTLDKLNKKIRQFARSKSIETKIIQTNDIGKYTNYIHRNRNKVDAYILTLGSWHPNAFTIKESLEIINLPYRIVENMDYHKDSLEESIFDKKNMIENKDFIESYNIALTDLDN